ncbi:hypothetical protein [Variovorax sp. ZT4R33]|uniref:hypothetical protein n=1 Tax=Variovorax sp. ZT4R33 TaxID=3443743 RepID=UPI003F47A50A
MKPIFLFSSQTLAAIEQAEEQFERDVKAMERRRSASGDYLSGGMLREVGDITNAVIASLCVRTEAAFVDVWTNSLWVSSGEAQSMLEASGTALARVRDLGLEKLESLKRLKLSAGGFTIVENDITRGYDAGRDRLLLFVALRQRAQRTLNAKRVLGLLVSAVRNVLRWLAGFVTR